MTAAGTHLTGPDAAASVRRMVLVHHEPLGDGYAVTVMSPTPLTGEKFLSVLRFARAIKMGFARRQLADDAAAAEMGV